METFNKPHNTRSSQAFENANNATLETNRNKKEQKSLGEYAVKGTAILAALAAAGTIGYNSLKNDSPDKIDDTYSYSDNDSYGLFDKDGNPKGVSEKGLEQFKADKIPSPDAVDLFDGGIIREDPYVQNSTSGHPSNVVGRIELSQIEQNSIYNDNAFSFVPEGAIYQTESVHDGSFYGITTEELKALFPEKAKKLEKDNDGIVWISEQRASAYDIVHDDIEDGYSMAE